MKSSTGGTLFYDYRTRISEGKVGANGVRKTKVRNEEVREREG